MHEMIRNQTVPSRFLEELNGLDLCSGDYCSGECDRAEQPLILPGELP